ncbi:MAG: 2-C-methyl-D-erythritol 4-phosphate cytidylyltransferase [Breznakia sp.]
MNYSVIVVAAGKGKRANLGYNKVLYKQGIETIIEKTMALFLADEECKEIILVVSEGEKEAFQNIFINQMITYVEGGKTRQESVYNGLKVVNSDYVMIHDGARPYLQENTLQKLKDTLQEEVACLLMVAVVDTIKIVKDGYVQTTLERAMLYAAQTPQCFLTSVILKAHEKARAEEFVGSDDAQLVERYSEARVKVVKGEYSNKKITNENDIK